MTPALTLHIEVAAYADRVGVLALCDEHPGLVGHGEDDMEAVADLLAQWAVVPLH